MFLEEIRNQLEKPFMTKIREPLSIEHVLSNIINKSLTTKSIEEFIENTESMQEKNIQ